MLYTTKKECTELFITKDFNYINQDIIKKLDPYMENTYPLYVAEDEESYCILPIWATFFNPKDQWTEDTIRENAQKIYEECNIIVLENEDFGILLGIDGAGYDFYEAHWLPLYDLLEYRWHTEE